MARRYKTAMGNVPMNVWAPERGQPWQPNNLGKAMTDILASLLFVLFAMGAILVMGTLGYAGLKGEWIWATAAGDKLLLASVIPWLIITVRFVSQAWQGFQLTQNQVEYAAWFKGAYAPQEPIREAHLVPVYMPDSTLDGIPIPMIVEFCEQIPHRGWTKRQWVDKYRFDNGILCDYPTWSKLCGILAKPKILVDREGNKKGRLQVRDPLEMLRRLRLSQYAYLLKSYHSDFEEDGQY